MLRKESARMGSGTGNGWLSKKPLGQLAFLTFVLSLEALAVKAEAPVLPNCQRDEAPSLFHDLWHQYWSKSGDPLLQDCGYGSGSRFVVLIPTTERLLRLAPQDRPQIYSEDPVLLKKLIYSHLFTKEPEISTELTIQLIPNARNVLIVIENDSADNLTTASGYRFTECALPGPLNVSSSSSCQISKVFNLHGVLEISEADIVSAIAHPNDPVVILYPETGIPPLGNETRAALGNMKAGLFAQIWSKLLNKPGTKILADDGQVMILAPTDESLRALIPELKPEVPDPLLNDELLMRFIVTNHLIVKEGRVPAIVFDRLSEGRELIKSSIAEEPVVFHKEILKNGESVIKANSIPLGPEVEAEGRISMYSVSEVLAIRKSIVDAAISRVAHQANVSDPFPAPALPMELSGHLKTADVPQLPDRIRFRLRSVGAGLFGSVWSDVKQQLQTEEAQSLNNSCLLPKDPGDCRLALSRFYYDPDSDSCRPFVYGGCAGNDNRFENVLDCAEKCVVDRSQLPEWWENYCGIKEVISSSTPYFGPDQPEEVVCRGGKFVFNVTSGSCEDASYASCLKFQSFVDLEQCSQTCVNHELIGKIDLRADDPVDCVQPPEVPTPVQMACNARHPKWTFHQTRHICVPHFYSGCGATSNLFDTQSACSKQCLKSTSSGVSSSVPGKLHIFAPEDSALQTMLQEVGETLDIFRRHPALGRKLLLSAMTYEYSSIEDTMADLHSLNPDLPLKRSTLTLFRKVLDEDNFAVYLANQVISVTKEDIRAAKLSLLTILPKIGKNFIPFGDAKLARTYQHTALWPVNEPMVKLMSDLLSPDSTMMLTMMKDQLSREAATLQSNNHQDSVVAPPLCSLPLDRGSGSANIDRWYFDPNMGYCRTFKFFGLQGNDNNFVDFAQCVDICGHFKGKVARADIRTDRPDGPKGYVTFSQANEKAPLFVRLRLTGLEPGSYGFHVHEHGNLTDGCKAAGSHFNPGGHSHGGPTDASRHVGDLGNVVFDEDRVCDVTFNDTVISLFGVNSILNRAVVLHAKPDDLGKGGDEESLKTGNAGARLACAVITEVEQERRAHADMVHGSVAFVQNGPHGPTVLSARLKDLPSGRQEMHLSSMGCSPDNDSSRVVKITDLEVVSGKANLESKTLHTINMFGDENDPQGIKAKSLIIRATTGQTVCAPLQEGDGRAREAVVLLASSSDPKLEGRITFSQMSPNSPVRITGTVTGLEPGLHGFHIHANGAIGDGCKAAGAHFNPFGHTHAAPDSAVRHLGDLGNIVAQDNHAANIDITDSVISMFGVNSILYKSVVVHLLPDDLGLGMNEESLKTGNAGGRLACGIIQPSEEVLVRGAEAVLDPFGNNSLRGKVSLIQQGRNHVKIVGHIFDMGVAKRKLQIREACPSSSTPSSSPVPSAGLPEQEVGAFESVDKNTDILLVNDAISLSGEHSIIGKALLVTDQDNGGVVACGTVRRSTKYAPDLCQLPPVVLTSAAELSDFSCLSSKWTYDSSLSKCVKYSASNCAKPTPNLFSTEAECEQLCPVKQKGVIMMVPSNSALRALKASHPPLSAGDERRLLLCHTIRGKFEIGVNSSYQSACGQRVLFMHGEFDGQILINDKVQAKLIPSPQPDLTIMEISDLLAFDLD